MSKAKNCYNIQLVISLIYFQNWGFARIIFPNDFKRDVIHFYRDWGPRYVCTDVGSSWHSWFQVVALMPLNIVQSY